MRVLKNEELKSVSGGTLGLLWCLFSWFGCGSTKSSGHGGGGKGGRGC